jgi:hypothetical protein
MPLTRHGTYDDEVVEDRTSRSWDASIVFRLIAVVAAAVMTVIGLIAVAQISWGDGFDAAAVDVAGIAFTPEVAVTVAAAGLVALVAAATADRASKLVVGALLVCAGVVVLATDTVTEPDWAFDDGLGWLAIGVGATLIVMAVLMQAAWSTHRVHQHRPITH